MSDRIGSYGFPTQPYVNPQQSFELSPDNTSKVNSQDFTRPEGFSKDFVSAANGGSFYGLVSYNSALSLTGNTNLVYKSWVENYVTNAIAEVEAGGLSQATIRKWFSSSSNPPLTYNNLTGEFTLDKNLSSYTNDIGFLTSFNETDPTVGAHIKAITPTNISNWNTAYGWGNHSGLYKDINYTPAWSEITDKPSSLPPSTHTHVIADVTDSTTVGGNLVKLTNPSAITFLRVNANNTVSTLSASDFRTAIGAGTSSTVGTVTSVGLSVPTGLTVSGSPITTNGTLALTLTAGYSIPTTTKQSQWDTAYGWGNHASAGYKTSVLEADVTQHEAALTIASTQITGLSIPTELGDLTDFPATTAASRVFRRNSGNTAYEFAALLHSDLGSLDGNASYVHLTQAQKTKIITAATNAADGYMTAAHVIALESALTEFTPGNLLSFTGTTLNVDSEVKPVDDTKTTTEYTWSAAKILSMFAGSTEDGAYAKSYTINIPAGADLATKLALGATGPTGWTFAATGGSSGDLQITHSIGVTPVGIAVYRINADSTKSRLEGAIAYGDAKSSSTDTILTLSSYANTSLATEIRISF